MIWNFGKGEVLKGNDVQLYIPLMPPCSPLTLDDVEDFTATFYTTIGGSAITKDLSDFTVSGVMGTIVLQAVELEALDDGVIRYNTHYTVTSTGMEEGYEFISSYFLKTPNTYTPIDFVASTTVQQVVEEIMSEEGLITSAQTAEDIAQAIASETARTEETYVKKTSMSSYYTSAQTNSAITQAMAAETARTEQTYLKEHQSLADYYTSAQTNEAISQAMAAETARTEQTYLKEHQSLADYYTSAQTNEAISTAIESQSATTSAQTEELISQAMAAETARTEQTYLKEHQSLANYYTSAQTNEAITEALAEYSGGTTSAQTEELISQAMAAETARTEQTYLKEHQSLADYYTSAQTDQAISSALTNSGFITSGDCQSQIETAMTNVVTSEEIRTIWKGSLAQYNAMSGHSNNTLYIIV